MQGIEKTLRDTLTKLGSPDEATRLKLYKATETILERSLAPYLDTQPDMVATRRVQLQEIINKLDAEYNGTMAEAPGAIVASAAPIAAISPTPTPTPTVQAGASPQSHSPEPTISGDNTSGLDERAPIVNTPSKDTPIDQPHQTSVFNHAPDIEVPERQVATTPEVVLERAAPIKSLPETVAPVVDETIDMTAAPTVEPARRGGQQSSVEWPDAATHPDRKNEQYLGHVEGELGIEQSTEPNPVVPEQSSLVSKAERQAQKKADKLLKRAEKRAQQKRKKRRGRSLMDTIAGSIVSIVFVVFLIGGAWLLFESEYYRIFLDWKNGGYQQTASANNQVSEEHFIPKPLNVDANQASNWVEVFGAGDVDKARGRGEVLVETIGGTSLGGVRITSVNVGEFGEALIPLNGQKLAPASSHKFALAMSMSVTEATQIYVRCLLKNGIEVGRRRFQLNGGQNDVLIDLDMTNVASFETQPYLAINSDITGSGKSVELYDVRFQVKN